jgi:hypothetical protein
MNVNVKPLISMKDIYLYFRLGEGDKMVKLKIIGVRRRSPCI